MYLLQKKDWIFETECNKNNTLCHSQPAKTAKNKTSIFATSNNSVTKRRTRHKNTAKQGGNSETFRRKLHKSNMAKNKYGQLLLLVPSALIFNPAKEGQGKRCYAEDYLLKKERQPKHYITMQCKARKQIERRDKMVPGASSMQTKMELPHLDYLLQH